MHPILSYIPPAIFLNPVLFLHGLNTILSRIIPPVVVAGTIQPPPYSTFGPSAHHPHIDIHASENLCWSYTLVMICAQLMAFGRVHRLIEESEEKRRLKMQEAERGKAELAGKPPKLANGHANAQYTSPIPWNGRNGTSRSQGLPAHPANSRDSDLHEQITDCNSSDTSEESEVIL
ncbi:MAG: hypothetical protein Q9219_006145 [cf. Caloplaca sp. 3 TL-2023]